MGLATAVLFTLAFVAVFLVITPAIKIARKIFESPKQPSQEPKKETSPTKDVSPAVEQQLSRTQRHDLASMRERVVDEYRLSGKVDIKELKKELDRKLGYAGLGDDFIQGLDRMSPDSRSAYFREGKDGSLRVFWNGSLLFQLKTDQSFSFLRILPPSFEGATDAGMARTVMAAVTAAGALAETAGARDVINRIEKIILCPDNIASIKRELIPEIVKADAKAIEKPDEELGERLDYARRRGISERFVEDSGNGPEINPKTISDSLAKGSGLTHIEVNNRCLAGKSFKGFNLLADDSNRISLSYAGQTVATLVRFEEEEPVEVNGKIEKRNISYFRTNTFPPKTSEDTLPSDITAMMEAAERIRTVDDDPNLVLQVMKDIFCEPDNLYIIGTMNTADRSIGYIDYAVRRRFSFYTLLADRSIVENFYENETLAIKATSLFDAVKNLISTHISPEFNPSDLMVGHSYFLAEDEDELISRLEYEVKPLLYEYANDGILINLEKEAGRYPAINAIGSANGNEEEVK